MIDQPKGTPDPTFDIPGQQRDQEPIEPELVQQRGMVMTPGRKKVLAVIVVNVLFWSAYAGHLDVGIALFVVFILWHWVVFGWQPAPEDVWCFRRDPGDSFSLGSMTGVVSGPESLEGRVLYDSLKLIDEQGRREQERRMR